MSKKTMGGVCAVICMVSVLVYFIWGTLAHSYENCWLVFMAAGIGCACVSKFDQAAARIEAELITNAKAMAPADYDFDQELETSSGMFGATSFAEGQEFLAVVKMAERVVAAMAE